MSQMAIGIPSTMGIRWILLHCNSRLIGPKTHWRVCNRMLFCHTRTTYIQGCKCLNKTIGKLEQNQSNWFPEMFKVGFLDAHCIFKKIWIKLFADSVLFVMFLLPRKDWQPLKHSSLVFCSIYPTSPCHSLFLGLKW